MNIKKLDSHSENVKNIIKNSNYLTISTCNNNETWIAPLHYIFDKDLNFYCRSETAAKHFQNVLSTPEVNAVIWKVHEDGDLECLQFQAKAQELQDNEIPNPSDIFREEGDLVEEKIFTTDQNFKYLKITPEVFWVRPKGFLEQDTYRIDYSEIFHETPFPMTNSQILPDAITEVGFEEGMWWSNKKLWELNIPVEDMSVYDLEWHFNIPFWWSKYGKYDIKPIDVLLHPDQYMEEYERTLNTDLSFPVDIIFHKGRWLFLDGLHRLLKAKILGLDKISVRKVLPEHIPLIKK